MISGESEFNEVFFTDARCPKGNVVGEVNGGWAVAMTLLGYERGEAAATFPLMFRTELDRLMALAQERGATADPRIRQRLAWCHTKVEVMRYLGMRSLTRLPRRPPPRARGGHLQAVLERVPPGGDRAGRRHPRAPTRWRPRAGGRRRRSRPTTPGAPNDSASWVGTFFNARAGTIYAGSSEIQRNILGEMVLGLPKEPKVDPGTWREQQAARS